MGVSGKTDVSHLSRAALEYKLERRNSRIIQNEDGVGDGYLVFSDYQRNVEKGSPPIATSITQAK